MADIKINNIKYDKDTDKIRIEKRKKEKKKNTSRKKSTPSDKFLLEY